MARARDRKKRMKGRVRSTSESEISLEEIQWQAEKIVAAQPRRSPSPEYNHLKDDTDEQEAAMLEQAKAFREKLQRSRASHRQRSVSEIVRNRSRSRSRSINRSVVRRDDTTQEDDDSQPQERLRSVSFRQSTGRHSKAALRSHSGEDFALGHDAGLRRRSHSLSYESSTRPWETEYDPFDGYLSPEDSQEYKPENHTYAEDLDFALQQAIPSPSMRKRGKSPNVHMVSKIPLSPIRTCAPLSVQSPKSEKKLIKIPTPEENQHLLLLHLFLKRLHEYEPGIVEQIARLCEPRG